MNRSSLIALALISISGCKNDDGPSNPTSGAPPRTFRMGFSAIPPKPDEQVLLRAVDMWSQRADAAIMHVSVPYKALLSGTTATTYVQTVDLPLANYFRAKNLRLVVMLDVTDGLNRSAEAPELVQLGRSIGEPAVQHVYRQYAQAMSSMVRPDYLGLAAETNLIRRIAPQPLYEALVRMTNDAAGELRAAGSTSALYVSVQVDVAWGRIINDSVYLGVEDDFRDFPFVQGAGTVVLPVLCLPRARGCTTGLL